MYVKTKQHGSMMLDCTHRVFTFLCDYALTALRFANIFFNSVPGGSTTIFPVSLCIHVVCVVMWFCTHARFVALLHCILIQSIDYFVCVCCRLRRRRVKNHIVPSALTRTPGCCVLCDRRSYPHCCLAFVRTQCKHMHTGYQAWSNPNESSASTMSLWAGCMFGVVCFCCYCMRVFFTMHSLRILRSRFDVCICWSAGLDVRSGG